MWVYAVVFAPVIPSHMGNRSCMMGPIIHSIQAMPLASKVAKDGSKAERDRWADLHIKYFLHIVLTFKYRQSARIRALML